MSQPLHDTVLHIRQRFETVARCSNAGCGQPLITRIERSLRLPAAIRHFSMGSAAGGETLVLHIVCPRCKHTSKISNPVKWLGLGTAAESV